MIGIRQIFTPALLIAAATLTSGCTPVASGSELSQRQPYIFVQQHNRKPGQYVRLGSALQVQLPGNPAVWTFDAAQSSKVVPQGRTLIYSPDRIEGTHSLFSFDFGLSEDAKTGDTGVITITSDNPPASLDKVLAGGVFRIEFEVIDAR